MVIWIIGMSASGKTSLGREMFNLLTEGKEPWVFLDGDILRSVFNDLGHTKDDRRKNAYRISNLCKILDSQGINVIACVLSIFHDNQKYNREILSDYKEVYLEVDFNKLVERDNKNLYKLALKGEIKDFVGTDIPFVPPYSPDLIINNNYDNPDFVKMASNAIASLGIELNISYKFSKGSRFLKPEKYQYTKYMGSGFLNSYKDTRRNAIKLLEGKIDSLIESGTNPFGDNNDIRYTEDYYNSNDEKINTEAYLLYLISRIQTSNYSAEDKNNIFTILKRFEVSKKIYSSYTKNEFKKADDNFKLILNYLLFAKLIIEMEQKDTNSSEQFILFNTLLKLTDIIISEFETLKSPKEIALGIRILQCEIDLYEKFERAIL